MDRRGFLLATTAVLAAGCARVPPPGAATTPQATAAAVPPVEVGSDGSPAGVVITQLLTGAATARGRSAASADAGADWKAALDHGDLVALPGYAGTLWSALSTSDEPPAADALLGELADLVGPELGVLSMPHVDGGLVWLVTKETAASGIASLSRVRDWSKGKVAAVPELAISRGDGAPGLKTVYGAQFRFTEVQDPVARAARLTSGKAAVAAFQGTEYTGASGLVALVDTEKLAAPDPAVVLVNSAFADAEPDAVLAMNDVAQALTTDALIELQAQVAAGGTVADVAQRWLVGQGLAG
nr:glycine betaine ABC transporter substrate-binding protein [Propionicimonas sp.]